VAENIATNESALLCPVCERSDMVRLYYERHFCDRCSGWLSWLQGSAEWDKKHRLMVAEAPIPSDPEPVPETAQKQEPAPLAPAASSPRRKGKSTSAPWECPRCRAQYPRPKGAGVCPACALGENPETVALVPLKDQA
jgi:hypothetical protein